MSTRQGHLLNNLNRGFILALTTTGLLLDGAQAADLLGMLALIVWLWMPLFTRLEARLLHWSECRSGLHTR